MTTVKLTHLSTFPLKSCEFKKLESGNIGNAGNHWERKKYCGGLIEI